ncbi:hypothetical protein ABNF97_04005 [Plantactinospora sp. B6F1]|uniref:hypothetical protein n=1 Tax=Plantactinospora sp. B6F1 TaxID=3158971 RepID=UPI0032D96510
MTRFRFPGVRFLAWHLLVILRQLLGLPPGPLLVDAIRCPRCRQWVKPRRFDLEHMACKTCVATLARPVRGGDWSCR